MGLSRSFILLIIGILLPLLSKATNTAQRLGFDKDARLLIIHNDDLGLSSSVNETHIELFNQGVVKTGSLMMPAPKSEEMIDYYKKDPNIDIGLHLTLNSEYNSVRWKPISPIDKVTSLINPDGFFWSNLETIVNKAQVDEVELEISSQIDRALELGLQPTHIDSHMAAMFGRMDLVDRYLKVAKKYCIPPLLMRWSFLTKQMVKSMKLPVDQIKNLLESAEKNGFVLVDTLIPGAPTNRKWTRKMFYKMLLQWTRPGVTQLIVHLDKDPNAKDVYGKNYSFRYRDYLIFSDPEFKKLAEKKNIHFIGWKDLLPLWNCNL